MDNKEKYREAYTKMFGESAYPFIEKAIDDEGWYCSEKNDRWLQVGPNQINLLEFRNGKKDLRPLVLGQ